MNLDAINEDPALKDTPIGDLVVVHRFGRYSVGVKNKYDPSRPPRIMFDFEPGNVVWDSIYGKRAWEDQHMRILRAKKKAQEERDHQARMDDILSDLRRNAERILRRGGDEAYADLLKATGTTS